LELNTKYEQMKTPVSLRVRFARVLSERYVLYKPLANDHSLQLWVYPDRFEPVAGSRRAQFF
jgi:hypothetical protein